MDVIPVNEVVDRSMWKDPTSMRSVVIGNLHVIRRDRSSEFWKSLNLESERLIGVQRATTRAAKGRAASIQKKNK